MRLHYFGRFMGKFGLVLGLEDARLSPIRPLVSIHADHFLVGLLFLSFILLPEQLGKGIVRIASAQQEVLRGLFLHQGHEVLRPQRLILQPVLESNSSIFTGLLLGQKSFFGDGLILVRDGNDDWVFSLYWGQRLLMGNLLQVDELELVEFLGSILAGLLQIQVLHNQDALVAGNEALFGHQSRRLLRNQIVVEALVEKTFFRNLVQRLLSIVVVVETLLEMLEKSAIAEVGTEQRDCFHVDLLGELESLVLLHSLEMILLENAFDSELLFVLLKLAFQMNQPVFCGNHEQQRTREQYDETVELVGENVRKL